MGKNAKIIIFSLIGLAVLGAVAAILILTAPKKDEPAKNNDFSEPVTASEKVDLTLCSRDEKDITSITVTNSLDTFSITPSGNTDSDGNVIWTIADIASAPLDADTFSNVVKYACSFDAKEFAETVADSSGLTKYGLDKPLLSFKTAFSDGTEFSLSVGNDVPNSSTTVYVTPDGKNVYTAYRSRISGFNVNRYGFITLEAMPGYDQSGSEEVLKMTVERLGLDEPLVLENISTGDIAEDEVRVYSFRMTSPYNAYVDLSDGPTFAYSIFGLTASGVSSISGKADPNYASFGLDDPVCTVKAETNIRTYSITVGAPIYTTETDDEGNEKRVLSGYYGTSSEHPDIVYIFSSSSVAGFAVDPPRLISKLFLMPYIYDLDTINYRDNTGRSLDFGIKLVQKADEEHEEITEFTVNGEKCDSSEFKSLYQFLISAAGEELYLEEDKGELIAEIVYNYADKSKGDGGKDTVQLYASNTDRKVIISLNGNNIFKTRQMYATQLFANIGNFLSGGEIVLTY